MSKYLLAYRGKDQWEIEEFNRLQLLNLKVNLLKQQCYELTHSVKTEWEHGIFSWVECKKLPEGLQMQLLLLGISHG